VSTFLPVLTCMIFLFFSFADNITPMIVSA
jgi:hypothetical protein